MLAKANRIVAATDYRRLVRSGRKARGRLTLAYGLRSDPGAPMRMGVIVARNVGNAVVRNRVRRRIKAVGRSLVDDVQGDVRGLDVVVRALPTAARAGFGEIDEELRRLVGGLQGRP